MASEKDSIQPRYRTFWRRFFAGMIDGLVFVPIYLIEELIIFEDVNFRIIAGESFGQHTSVENTVLIMSFNILLMFFYSFWMTGKYGQTIGKIATRIQVLDEADEKSFIGMRRAIYRDAPLVLIECFAIVYMIVTYDVSEQSVAIKLLNFAAFIWILAE